jgi:hypothetical protein
MCRFFLSQIGAGLYGLSRLLNFRGILIEARLFQETTLTHRPMSCPSQSAVGALYVPPADSQHQSTSWGTSIA